MRPGPSAAIMASTMIFFLAIACNPAGTPPPKEEKPPDFQPNLPSVPAISVPNVPINFPDGSYSVYGLRKKQEETLHQRVRVTARVVDTYEKPFCPEGKTCPPAKMPHLWLADTMGEKNPKYRLTLVGYAEGFQQMAECKEKAEKGIVEEIPEGVELPPCVWDFERGHNYLLEGWYTVISSHGFQDSDGLLEYKDHKCLDCPVEEGS
jgi:hypothetical protein